MPGTQSNPSGTQTKQTQEFSRLSMEAALKAAQCATHCIETADKDHVTTAKLCLDLTHLAQTCGTLTARGSEYARRLAQLCSEVATKTADACERIGDHEVMKDCARACRELAEAAEGVAMQQSP